MTHDGSPVRNRVLLVADLGSLVIPLQRGPRAEGFEVFHAAGVREAEHLMRTERPRLLGVDASWSWLRIEPDVLRRWKTESLFEMSALFISPAVRTRTVPSHADVVVALSGTAADFQPRLHSLLLALHPTRKIAAPEAGARTKGAVKAPEETALYGLEDGRHQGRCGSCLRASPALPNVASDAASELPRLGWRFRDDGWTCPICVDRSTGVRPRIVREHGLDREARPQALGRGR